MGKNDENVNALLAMDNAVESLEYDQRYEDAGDLEKARAAVAELISAARISCELGRVTDGLRAALAQVGGAA